MIIECENCETRFHLDDERVPDSGVKVRCSKCKHAFRVSPADARDGETIDAIAADAIESQGLVESVEAETAAAQREVDFDGDLPVDAGFGTNHPPADSGTELPPALHPGNFDSPTRPLDAFDETQPGGGEDDEQDWEFNVDPPEPEFDHAAAVPDQVPSFLDDLGNPESWDLVGDSSAKEKVTNADPHPETLDDPFGEEVHDRVQAEGPAEPAADLVPPAKLEVSPAEERVDRLPAADHTSVTKNTLLPSIAGASAWGAIWLIAALAVWRMLPGASADAFQAPVFRFGTVAVESPLAVRSENLFQGATTIVSAKLRNQGERLSSLNGVLRVEMVGESGNVLATAPLIRADSSDLRQAEPDAYARHAERGALELGRRPLRPDEGIPVRAVLAGRLPEAVGIRFALESLPAGLPAEAPLEGAPPDIESDPGAGDIETGVSPLLSE